MTQKIVLGALIGLAAVLVIAGLMPPRTGSLDLTRFGQLPVQEQGRVKPMDSVARNSLILLRNNTALRYEVEIDGETETLRITPIQWLADHTMRPEIADRYPVFRIDHPQTLDLLGLSRNEKYFSFNEIRPQMQVLQAAFERLNPEPNLRDAYQRQIARLVTAIDLYAGLRVSLNPGSDLNQLGREYASYLQSVGAGAQAIQQKLAGDDYDQAAHDRFVAFGNRYADMGQQARLGIIPPDEGDTWLNVGQGLLDSLRVGGLPPVVAEYALLTRAWRDQDAAGFTERLIELEAIYTNEVDAHPARTGFEHFFNTFDPFLRAEMLYVLAFLLAAISWLVWPKTLTSAAFWVLLIGFLVHTFGLAARIYILGRPPVINLYSSAIFVGWGVVLFAFVLEKILKNGIATAAAAIAGFSTLLVAGGLQVQSGGETMEMMRAVLDSNFWLATHVIIITIGYSAMFLAGLLGALFILFGLISSKLDQRTSIRLDGSIYGITCFALLLSFVGTMLGGIWADQSWGRFWGWDPKENGALMIVLWGAVMLHARWGKLVTRRGFACLAVGGNIITSWSWFGTNMLGIGLHSYGFMDAAFWSLMGFIVSQLLIIIAGTLPATFWRSQAALPASTKA